MASLKNKVCIHCNTDFIDKNYSRSRKYCSVQCYRDSSVFLKGIIKGGKARLGQTHNWGDKISLSKLGKPRPDMVGENNPNWNGGTSSDRLKDMQSIKYKQWRLAVFIRDEYTCQKCSIKNGLGKTIRLEAHHIKTWKDYPELRHDTENGTTLCRDCHLQEHYSTDGFKKK